MQDMNMKVNVSGETETSQVSALFDKAFSPGIDLTQLGGHW